MGLSLPEKAGMLMLIHDVFLHAAPLGVVLFFRFFLVVALFFPSGESVCDYAENQKGAVPASVLLVL